MSRHLQPHVSLESMSCLTFRPCTRLPNVLCSYASLAFQLEAEQSRTSTALGSLSRNQENVSTTLKPSMLRDVAGSGVALVELGPAAAVHHLEENSPEVTQWTQRSMTARGTAGISRCSKMQKYERMTITSLARCPCQLLAARGQPNEEVRVDKCEKICPSHYQSAGTLGLAQARKWQLS